MENELSRVASFSSWTANANVSPITLARCGFCYDGTQGTIRCAACDVEFDPLELSISSIRERHREHCPGCPFALAASAPNTPPNLPRSALRVGGHTETDHGSQIGPDGRRNDSLRSALARATRLKVFQANSGGNTEPPGSDSPPGEHADPQGSTQDHVLYRREPSGSHSLPGSHAYPQGSTQGHVVYRREPSGSHSLPGLLAYPQSSRNQRVTTDDAVSAVMDRDEVSVLMPIIERLSFNENDLRTLVTERLSQGDDCLIPRKLLEALLMYRRM